MENELISQKICEICGVEPVNLTECFLYNEKHFGSNYGKECIYLISEEYNCDMCPLMDNIKTVMVDFTEPKNFMSLLELRVDDRTLWSIVGSNSTSVNSFLNDLYNYLKEEFPLKDQIVNQIKTHKWNI